MRKTSKNKFTRTRNGKLNFHFHFAGGRIDYCQHHPKSGLLLLKMGICGGYMINNLINKKACKQLALQWAKDNRKGWMPTRVSGVFLDDLDTKVRLLITSAVAKHRSVGKTIIDLF